MSQGTHRHRSAHGLADETADIAQTTVEGGTASGWGSAVTGLASATALVFSAISLYHSVLKQPELAFHVSPVMHYTRDANGNYEVFAVPLTIANHGARDGIVLDLELIARPAGGGEEKHFYSAYMVDGSFFLQPGGYDMERRRFERVDRPKTPFAPISVAGRSNYTGTLLFYRKHEAFPKIVSQAGEYDVTVRLNAKLDDSLGVLDSYLAKVPEPVTKRVKLSYYSEQTVLRGGTHPLIDVAWQKGDTEAGSSGEEGVRPIEASAGASGEAAGTAGAGEASQGDAPAEGAVRDASAGQ